MKISSIQNTKFNYKNDFYTSNSIQKQNFTGLTQYCMDLFSNSSDGEEYINPITKQYDESYASFANFLNSNRVEGANEILYESLDLQSGEVNFAFIRMLPFVSDIKAQSLKGKIVVALNELSMNLKTNFKYQKLIGASAKYSNVANLIHTFKDNNGAFNDKNEKFFYKLLSCAGAQYKHIGIPLDLLSQIIDMSKDENGIVEKKKAKFAVNLLRKVPKYDAVALYLATLETFDEDKKEQILKDFNSLNVDENYRIKNLYLYTKYCLDENNQVIPEMKEYLVRLYNANKDIISEAAFLGAKYGKNAQDFIIEHTVKNAQNAYETHYLVKFLQIFEPDSFDDDFLDLALNYREVFGSFQFLDEFGISCLVEETNASDKAKFESNETEYYFSDDIFNEVLKIMKFQSMHFSHGDCILGAIFANIISGNFRAETYPYDDKIHLYSSLLSLKKAYVEQETKPDFDISYIDNALDEIENSLVGNQKTIAINKTTKKEFISEILSSKKDAYTDFENTLIASIDLFKEYGRTGLPLKYSRQQFIDDFNNLNCNCDKKISILKRFGATQVNCDEFGKIIQFDGVLKPEGYNYEDKLEIEASALLNKFLFENEVQTSNLKLNQYLNSLIKALPEFVSIIGKQQHKTQNYSLDIHMLLALCYCVKNPSYFNLAQNDRAFLKFSAMLHDIAKKEGIVDSGHQYLSSEYADTVASKIFSHPEVKARISEFVASHHWLAMYNTDNDTAPLVAFDFRRPTDFTMAQIMAEADLKAVGTEFYDKLKYALEDNNLLLILQSRAHLMSCVNLYFANSFVNKAKLKSHVQNYNGNDYCVIDLKRVNDDDDVSKFGFKYGTKKQDLKLCVHMVDSDEIDKSLHTLKTIIKPSRPGVLSASLITPNLTRTYKNRKHGLMLSYNTCDVLTAKDRNIYSGYRKSLSDILESFSNDPEMIKTRIRFSHELMNMLGFEDHQDWDYLYAGFYAQYLSKLTSISDIDPEIEFVLGDVKFSGVELIKALEKLNNELIDSTGRLHNELLVYLPRLEAVISKAESLEEVPQELLEFAQENNLPVVLI